MSPTTLRFLFALLLLQTGAYFVPPATWNPVSRFALTRAMVETGRFELGDFAEATGDRAQVGERFFSEKSPMPSLVATPAYALTRGIHVLLGRPPPTYEAIARNGTPAIRLIVNRSFSQLLYVCAVAAGAVPFAILGWLLLGLLLARFPPVVATWAALLTMFGTLLLPYGTSFYGHVLAGCALLGAAALLDGHAPGGRRLVGAGALLGLAITTEYLSVVPASALGLWLLRAQGPERVAVRLLRLASGAAIPGALLALYNTACFGAPWRSGYAFVTLPLFVSGHARGIMGVSLPDPVVLWESLFGPSRGLFRLSPLALVGALGLAGFVRERRDDRLALAMAAGLVALLVVNSGYYMWWGGAAGGPRHVVPALPVLALGLAWALSRPGWRWAAALTGAVSCAVMLAFAAVGVEAPEQVPALDGYLLPRLAAGAVASLQGASNLGILLGLSPAASLGPLLACWVLGARALVVAARKVHSPLDR